MAHSTVPLRLLSILALTASTNSFAFTSQLPDRFVKSIANDKATLKIEFLADDLLHIEVASLKNTRWEKPIWTSPMIAKTHYDGPSRMSESGGVYETADLRVAVDQQTLCVEVENKVTFYSLGKLCPRDVEADWKTFTLASPAARNVYGLGQFFRNPGSADGDLRGVDWDPGMNGHGNHLRGFNGGANGFATFPMAYVLGDGTQAFGFFFDHVYKQRWNLATAPWEISSFGDQARFYFIGGSDIRDVRHDYMELTGKPPVPPAKAFGFWVSEFGFDNWGEIDDELASLEEHNFPVDGFGLDIQWFGGRFYERGADTRGGRMGSMRFDENNFGNPANKIRELREEHGVDLMPIEEPYVSKFLNTLGIDAYDVMASKGFLARECPYGAPIYLDANPWWGVGSMVDFTNPDASAEWHRNRRRYLVDLGIQYHWTDLGEPEMYSDNACYHGFPELVKHRQGDIHNVYNLRWAEGIAEGYRSTRRELDQEAQKDPAQNYNLRPFVMSRSGTVGIQRFGVGMWSGDIAANMGALTAHYNSQMHMSLVGIDYYNSDVGGFHRRPDTLDGDENELFTQWLANASLFDFPIRSHVWNLADNLQTNPTRIGWLDSNRFNIRLRYQLFPYYYSLAHAAATEGEALVPPLVYHFPEDARARTIGNQKMIGRWLMAGMVARYGERQRDVYFPKGTWIDFHTDQRHVMPEGGDVRGVTVMQDGILRLPLFAREGAIIPMRPVDDETRNITGWRRDGTIRQDLNVRIYPSTTPTTFDVVEDDGRTVLYREGQVARTTLSQKKTSDGIEIGLAKTEGDFPALVPERAVTFAVYLADAAVDSVAVGGKPIARCGDDWTAMDACFEQVQGRPWANVRLPSVAQGEGVGILLKVK